MQEVKHTNVSWNKLSFKGKVEGITHDKHSCFPHGYHKSGISTAYTDEYMRIYCNPITSRVGSFSETMYRIQKGV